MSTALTNAPAASRPSALAVMASKINVEPAKLHATLKATVFKGATDEELLALVVVANTYGLNPLLKELYAFPAKGGGIVPVVSVDGWISMVNNHPQMDGLDFEDHRDSEGRLIAVTAIIYRKDRSRPIKVTEYLSECKRNTEPWKMENRMLRHKALIQCARVAFGFSGVTDEDEAADTPGMRAAVGREVEAPVNPFAPGRKVIAAPERQPEEPQEPDDVSTTDTTAPAEKSGTQRRDECLEAIDRQLAENFDEPVTRAQFEAMLRKQNLLSATGTLMGKKLADLEVLAGRVSEIVATAREGGEGV